MGIHKAFQKDSAGVFSPGTSQIDGSLGTVTEQPAAVENISVFLLPGRRGGGKITIDRLSVRAFRGMKRSLGGKYFTFLEEAYGSPKDEIHIPTDMAVYIVLSAHGAGQILTGADKTAGLCFLER